MSDNYLKKDSSGTSSKVMGGIFILIGLIFIVFMYTDFELRNWWALFTLIPIGFLAIPLVQDVKTNGRLTAGGAGSLVGILAMLLVMSIFLFGLSWNLFVPAGLIFAGIVIFLGSQQ